ncbi:nuclear transport factor 2 family protein [Streptomyces poriticola]|uniref:nuclear transport factor 2 family protein n=1 Tax=Streptomyces poriticola TaxID=3120506 RepID=UPI002FCE27BF
MAAVPDRAEQERVWALHTESEFVTLDLDAAMSTMTDTPTVLHVPTAMGARGRDEVRDFYGRWFVGRNAEDFATITLARTADGRRIVDEMIASFTHDVEIPWILPGVAPTGARISVPVVAVVEFEGTLIAGEHIYWDQASVLAQAGLLERSLVSRLPVVTDQPAALAHGDLNTLAEGTR